MKLENEDAISSALEDNESSPRLTTFVIQTKANLRKWRRSLKARIQLSKGDNGGGDEVIEVDTDEVIDERCGHVVIDPKDDNKCAECREQYKERDYYEWLECPMCKQWLGLGLGLGLGLTLLYFNIFETHFCNRLFL